MFKELLHYVLPPKIVDSFALVDLQEQGETLHLYLDECQIIPEEYKELCL
ncbi:MAG: hypothetical protein FWD66_04270 [Paludibacter sp.]|nr:hypothetical protein [Paludibacter sp.]